MGDIKPGDKVHLGFRVKGGAGFEGIVTKIENNIVHIKNKEGRTFAGPANLVSPLNEGNNSKDELEMLKLMNKAMKQVPQSPAQKETIKQLNIIRKRNEIEPLREGVVGGLVFNSRRDEQWWKRRQKTAVPLPGDDAAEPAMQETSDPKELVTLETEYERLQDIMDKVTEKGGNYKNTSAYSKSQEIFKKIKAMRESLSEDVAANFAGGDPNPNVAGLDEPFRAKPKKDLFAGCQVFEVDEDTMMRSVNGKPKWARYKNYMSLEDFPNVGQDVKDYAKRNPTKSIVLKEKRTGRMIYLKGFKQ